MKLPKSLLPLLFLAMPLVSLRANPDHDRCKDVSGPFSSIVVGGPNCASPVGICTHGLLTGNFHATYDFTMVTLQPANDPNDPSKFIYTGTSIITLRSGKQMFSVDTGVMHIVDPTAVPFVTTANIYTGTGQYQSGQFIASGLLNFVTGDALGSYVGEICKENDDESEND
jgi:hypothetical protein